VAWVVAGAAAAVWVVLLALLAARNDPRRVAAGPPTLEPGGDEPAAVVGLITGDWEPHRDAVTATVLDLAARRLVAIEWIAPRTFVRVREPGADDDAVHELAPYERQVLDHLRALSRETSDGWIPAEALTTGPERESAAWLRRFKAAVVADARARGLSQARWGTRARTVLGAWGLVVGLAVGVAATTLPRDKTDDDPVGTALALGVVTAVVRVFVAGRLRGERDTDAGRTVAARWLGLRAMLADDPTFPTQPPAAVAVWGRLMGVAAAMGLTGAAVDALPLGAESERQAWSPVGDRWRPVSIRYPDWTPPGYGRHPLLVAFTGFTAAVVGVFIGPSAVAAGRSILDGVATFTTTGDVPWWIRLVVGLIVGVVIAGGVIAALAGAAMLVGGVADLTRSRRVVEGRVLRIRERGDDDKHYWHVAVDDGTSDRVRAWRLGAKPAVAQGDTVRASVSPWLAHVRDLVEVERTVAVPGASDAADVAAPGRAGPLVDDATATEALGRAAHRLADAPAHPLAVDGASATFGTDDGGRLIAAWIGPAAFAALQALPRTLAPAVPGIGDEAYRAPTGGGVIARVGDRVLMTAASLPDGSDAERDAAVDALARASVGAGGPTG